MDFDPQHAASTENPWHVPHNPHMWCTNNRSEWLNHPEPSSLASPGGRPGQMTLRGSDCDALEIERQKHQVNWQAGSGKEQRQVTLPYWDMF